MHTPPSPKFLVDDKTGTVHSSLAPEYERGWFKSVHDLEHSLPTRVLVTPQDLECPQSQAENCSKGRTEPAPKSPGKPFKHEVSNIKGQLFLCFQLLPMKWQESEEHSVKLRVKLTGTVHVLSTSLAILCACAQCDDHQKLEHLNDTTPEVPSLSFLCHPFLQLCLPRLINSDFDYL